MIEDINKLQNANASTAIQRNLLLTHNDMSVSMQTLYNKTNSENKKHIEASTDAERLLASLKTDPHVTYFAMFAESFDNELLTINKTKTNRIAKYNNIRITGYVQSQHNNTNTPFIPQVNDAINEIASQLIVRNHDTHKVKYY